MNSIASSKVHLQNESPTQTAQPRLVRAAHEFEAQMMKELLKPMTGSDPLTGEDSESSSGSLGDSSGSSGALGEFAAEALGRAMSEGGGFGIANRIVADLSHASHRVAARPVTHEVHRDTKMNFRK